MKEAELETTMKWWSLLRWQSHRPQDIDGCVPPPARFPLPFFPPIPHSLSLPVWEGIHPQKKATLVTGHRADVQGENWNDTVDISKVLQEHVLEMITAHGVTFEDDCMLPLSYKEFYVFI